MVDVLNVVGNKKFSATLNGTQLTGNNLLTAAQEAGPNSTIGVNTAQAADISLLVSAIQAAATKNFSAELNGAQLGATPNASNHLQRAVEAAAPLV